MAGFRPAFHAVKGDFAAAMREIYRPVAEAATGAVSEIGDTIKIKGRAQIMAAGFRRNYATAFRVDVYPSGRRPSAKAALVAYHKIDYSETFEEGARIQGRPYLWVPLSGGTRVGKKRLRVKDFIARGEKLFLVKQPGKPPLLFGKPLSGMKKPRRAHQRKTYERYQKGGAVPLFVGIDVVTIGKKLGIYPMIDAEAARLPGLYLKHLRAE